MRIATFLRLALTSTLLAAVLVTPASAGNTSGPDVTVFTLGTVDSYGPSGGLIGYHVGTTSCNVGDVPVWWCDNNQAFCEDDQHPVIAQNVYRMKPVTGIAGATRFEQIGMSWLKHGFVSTNSSAPGGDLCGTTACQTPPHGGEQLGIGCLDTYWASLNASRPLGMRSEVDATQGTFPFPETVVAHPGTVDQRAQVLTSDVEPDQNPGAVYWVEGQYVTADDAQADNGLNNASYRRVSVQSDLDLTLLDNTIRQKAAITAWPTEDPNVELVNVDVSDGGITTRFHVARSVTAGGPEGWHYEYAVHNLNSDRAARSFAVEFAGATTISGVGFRNVPHHSGEPYATTDWDPGVDAGAGTVSWSTQTFAENEQANALRWGTMFSFWFDADRPPGDLATQEIILFKPGSPTSVTFQFPLFADGFESGNTSAW